MWSYEKKLQYPVNIKNPNPAYAKIIMDQYGGPDGELGASLRYLSQRYSMPCGELKGLLTDIGIEEKYCAFQKKIPEHQKTDPFSWVRSFIPRLSSSLFYIQCGR